MLLFVTDLYSTDLRLLLSLYNVAKSVPVLLHQKGYSSGKNVYFRISAKHPVTFKRLMWKIGVIKLTEVDFTSTG